MSCGSSCAKYWHRRWPAGARWRPRSAGRHRARRTRPMPGPPAFAPTTVLAVLDEAADIKTFRLARPEGCEFSAGQFLAVRVLIDGKPHVRCYSISSAPHTRGYLEISVRRQGLVSGTLHATLRAGSTLTINRPSGQFVYPQGDDRPARVDGGWHRHHAAAVDAAARGGRRSGAADHAFVFRARRTRRGVPQRAARAGRATSTSSRRDHAHAADRTDTVANGPPRRRDGAPVRAGAGRHDLLPVRAGTDDRGPAGRTRGTGRAGRPGALRAVRNGRGRVPGECGSAPGAGRW